MDEVAWDEQSNIAAVHQQHKSISIRSLEWADWFDLICCGHCRPLRIENGIILWNEIMEWTMKQRKKKWSAAAASQSTINKEKLTFLFDFDGVACCRKREWAACAACFLLFFQSNQIFNLNWWRKERKQRQQQPRPAQLTSFSLSSSIHQRWNEWRKRRSEVEWLAARVINQLIDWFHCSPQEQQQINSINFFDWLIVGLFPWAPCPSAKQKPTAIPILKENCWMVCAVAEWAGA